MPNRLRKQGLVALSAVLIALFPIAALAAPGDILFSDNFSVDTGTMNGSVGGNNPSFQIIFQIRID